MSITPVSFRFAPEVKDLLEQAAKSVHRSQANFMEFLIIEYCKKEGIQPASPLKAPAERSNKQSSN